jgi:hypothetical protein
MPVHNWTRAQAGDFHHFHQRWISALTDALNGGGTVPARRDLQRSVAGIPGNAQGSVGINS